MEAVGIFVGLFFLLAPVVIIATVIYFVVRRRNGQEGITISNALMTYFYAMTGASIVVTSVGMGFLLYALLVRAFDTGHPVADDVTKGFAMLLTGLVFCVSHIFGRGALEKKEGKTANALRRVYLFFMLAIYSVAGLVSVPTAVYMTANYYVKESAHVHAPSGALATAIVVVPLWIYYLMLALKETRASKKEETAKS